ncbi:MAG: tRNA (5-methylaminomethyl-2-thiouridine)(34)-methyltransferase MnmD [Trueperaceae bacterium]
MDELERQVTDDGSATLFSTGFNQTFHSRHGAVAESLHVFLAGSGADRRLRSGLATKVLEVGFGTGLNFLLSAQTALAGNARLAYVALERDLLPATLVSQLGYGEYAAAPLEDYLRFRERLGPPPSEGLYRGEITGALLELRLGDASAIELEEDAFDAIYHDAFSPDANPELWSLEFLARLAAALAPGGTLATYTVKGEVRRRLQAAGLQVSKVSGPAGGKREMLIALRTTG